MDSLRNSIGLRAYGQRDPLIEYKAEAFKIFEELMVNVKTEICHNIFRSASSLMAFDQFLRNMPQRTVHQETTAFGGQTATASSGGAAKPSDMVSERVKPFRARNQFEQDRRSDATIRVPAARSIPLPAGPRNTNNAAGRMGEPPISLPRCMN